MAVLQGDIFLEICGQSLAYYAEHNISITHFNITTSHSILKFYSLLSFFEVTTLYI